MKSFKKPLAALVTAGMILPTFGSIPVLAASGVAINSTNFPDAQFREAISVHDTNRDGYLSQQEIDYTINIHCENMGVYSVQGIEYFTELEGLWCKGNHISDWDLSSNTHLKGIWCSNNDFTSLDFTGLDELVWVYCFECQLTSINFRNNPELAYIECNSNPDLSSLDVTQNSKLENLFCSRCGLTSLDLSGNPLLCELAAFKNNLTSLDVSNNPKLKRLDVWDNENLGNVDISGLP